MRYHAALGQLIFNWSVPRPGRSSQWDILRSLPSHARAQHRRQQPWPRRRVLCGRRLERHASAHMPDLWELMLEGQPASGSSSAPAAARRLQALLQPALALLQQYINFPSESAAVLGVNQLHSLLQAASVALGSDGWQAALHALDALCLADPWRPESEGSRDGTPGSGSNGGSLLAAAAAAEAIRRRSRLAVLLQRVLDSLLEQQGQALPGGIQLQLLDLLHRTVLAAAESNSNAGRRLATEHALVAGAAAAAQARLSTGAKWAGAGGGAAWMLAADATGGAAAAGDATPLWAATPPPAADDAEAGPLAGGAAIPEWEQLRPALVRQEAEGGRLYIAALQRCVAAACGGGGGGSGLAAECEARLAAFCLWVVSRAADRVAQQGGASDGDGAAAAAPEGSPGAVLAAATAAGSPGPALPGNGAAPNPADQPWEDAVRCAEREHLQQQGWFDSLPGAAQLLLACCLCYLACWLRHSIDGALGTPMQSHHLLSLPSQSWHRRAWLKLSLLSPLPWRRAPLVDAALRAFAGLSPAAWAAQQGAAFPHLARLVCSPSRPLRKSLQALLRGQVPPCLAADARS